MGCVLSSPVELVRVQRGGSSGYKVAVAEMQGWRVNHEDSHAFSCQDCDGNWGAFCVLDGHGGEGAAQYGSPEYVASVSKPTADGQLPPNEEIEEGFKKLDADLHAFIKKNPDKDSGSTVIASIVVKQADGTYSAKLLNCGDSRGVIARGPTEVEAEAAAVPVTLPGHIAAFEAAATEKPKRPWHLITETVDHKPSHPTEKARIEAAGGSVTCEEPPRLDGNLAVSRGIGDFEYKSDPKLPVPQQKVSCVPDIYEVHGLREGTIIVLACDGLWDVVTSEAAVEYVRDALIKNPKADLGDICTELINMSQVRNSRDNVTVMIVHCVDGTAWSCRSDKFNGTDEMKNFDKLTADLDDEMKKQYMSFLRKCKFPPEPAVCSVTGQWFQQMWQCPGTGNLYGTRASQKKGWKRHKDKQESEALKAEEAPAPMQADGA
eukprot:gnl/TRDRNA2_/TRDRNA2_189609_c0_seq1.p1 gnl/TRDRNA2_/TRDRNA2_189609_c0~~gnl/TRDRNA2_/TRDRNA2_189609_c0_seq1.p1  ORF type:complete len:454 (+),score=110.36 gnl/TRDRNA2_/TRDRNA2_189609_c0_seq1:66-1364(+)